MWRRLLQNRATLDQDPQKSARIPLLIQHLRRPTINSPDGPKPHEAGLGADPRNDLLSRVARFRLQDAAQIRARDRDRMTECSNDTPQPSRGLVKETELA